MNNNTMSGVKCFLTLFGLLVLALPAQAASFDCTKAVTKVEKLICGDAELSKLDEELNLGYKTALQNEKQSDTIKQAQKQWMKERNVCQVAECLESAYKTRIKEMVDAQMQVEPSPHSKMDGTEFSNEAEKLKFMQGIVKQHIFQFASFLPKSEFCEQFMNDFLENKNIQAVEPDVQTNVENDVRLAKWNSCQNAAEKPADVEAYEYLSELGGPPYRYYQIDIDGNPKNGKEDVIYTEIYKVGDRRAGTGHTGYHWIDLATCTGKGGAPVDAQFPPKPIPPKIYHLSMVVKYSDHYLAVELYPIGSAYRFRTDAFDSELNHHGYYCPWNELEKNNTKQ